MGGAGLIAADVAFTVFADAGKVRGRTVKRTRFKPFRQFPCFRPAYAPADRRSAPATPER